ncbi:MAG: hypothetical protein ACYC1Z_07860 [Georgenia sp.]
MSVHPTFELVECWTDQIRQIGGPWPSAATRHMMIDLTTAP